MSQDFDLPVNPYAPVVAQPGLVDSSSQAVEIRKAHISGSSEVVVGELDKSLQH